MSFWFQKEQKIQLHRTIVKYLPELSYAGNVKGSTVSKKADLSSTTLKTRLVAFCIVSLSFNLWVRLPAVETPRWNCCCSEGAILKCPRRPFVLLSLLFLSQSQHNFSLDGKNGSSSTVGAQTRRTKARHGDLAIPTSFEDRAAAHGQMFPKCNESRFYSCLCSSLNYYVTWRNSRPFSYRARIRLFF